MTKYGHNLGDAFVNKVVKGDGLEANKGYYTTRFRNVWEESTIIGTEKITPFKQVLDSQDKVLSN